MLTEPRGRFQYCGCRGGGVCGAGPVINSRTNNYNCTFMGPDLMKQSYWILILAELYLNKRVVSGQMSKKIVHLNILGLEQRKKLHLDKSNQCLK
uniref:Uncharacterized protein n=1 Tax=Romanomermis culicivorax TaxID=13658 RepID=A0A915IQI6_ROMCU